MPLRFLLVCVDSPRRSSILPDKSWEAPPMLIGPESPARRRFRARPGADARCLPGGSAGGLRHGHGIPVELLEARRLAWISHHVERSLLAFVGHRQQPRVAEI